MPIFEKGHKIDKYVVKSLIKENLYTETYKVEDEDYNPFFLKAFILKRLPEKLINKESGNIYEIEFCQNIRHKNIISFIANGKTETAEGECQYYVTNYLGGELISEKIFREKRIAADVAVEIFKGILEGLKHIHSMGICHNDITPNNIMLLTQSGNMPEIIDLGHASKRCNGKVPFDTSDLAVFFSANETFAGIYDEQSDIFAATAVLYTMITGVCPWKMEFPENAQRSRKATLLKDYRKANPIDFSTLEVEDKIKAVLQKGLSVAYGDRYKDIDGILSDLGSENIEFHQEKKQTGNTSGHTQNEAHNESDTRNESPNKVDFEIKRGCGNGFKDIAGMKSLKDYLYQRVIFVIQNKEKAEEYKLTTPNGMLLYGPPGCGKTFVAEKFAEETGFNFILVKSSDVASSFLHGSQEKIAQLFKQAEKNAPIVICFDEFDALVPDRSSLAASQTSSEVNEFLTQMNNCAKRGIFVVGTTNRPDKIDPAVLRTGRIDKLVYVPLPDKEARKDMFFLHIEGRPYDSGIDFDRLAEITEGYIASDIAYVVNDAAMVAAFTDKKITQELLEESISNTRPSLGKDTLNIYETIRNNMENTERRNMNRPQIGFIHYD
ncbi:MAG: AAA family ATPase [Bacteroidaceae bacterium]|nr:AAA family ATPase [Bacteroidaceae bacterium]